MLVAQSANSNDLLGPLIAPGDGIGDLRLVPKALLFGSKLLSVALATPVTFPTGNGDAYLSHGSVTFAPELRLESDALPVRLAASAGMVLRNSRDFANLTVGNALTYGIGGELPFTLARQRLAVLATLAGEKELQQSGSVERPMELLGALRWLLPANLQFTFGGGPGLTDGYGTPRFRVFAGIGFDPSRPVRHVAPPIRTPLLVQDFPTPAPAPVPPPEEPDEPMPPVEITDELPPLPPIERIVRDGHIALLAHLRFKYNDATILPASTPLLEQVIQVLRDSPEIRKVRIDGHTDGKGTPAYNRKLSRRRAQSVLQFLVQAGIDRSRLDAKGFGPDRPVVPNDTASHRAKNRRVEFVVLDGPKPPAPQTQSGGDATGTNGQ
jgi:outer membrane protein OmpA-like peptidoglycan-associated protein